MYLLFTDEDSDNPMPDKLKTMYEGENFQLYRIIKPGMNANAMDTPKKPIKLNAAATRGAGRGPGARGRSGRPGACGSGACGGASARSGADARAVTGGAEALMPRFFSRTAGEGG